MIEAKTFRGPFGDRSFGVPHSLLGLPRGESSLLGLPRSESGVPVCVSRALRGGRGKEEPLSAIATVLQAAPGDDDLPPPGPPRHTSAA